MQGLYEAFRRFTIAPSGGFHHTSCFAGGSDYSNQATASEHPENNHISFSSGRSVSECLNFTYHLQDNRNINTIVLKETGANKKDVVTVYSHSRFGKIFASSDCQNALSFDLKEDLIRNYDSEHSNDLHNPESPLKNHTHFKISKGRDEDFVKKILYRHKVDDDFHRHYQEYHQGKKIIASTHSIRAIYFSSGNFIQNQSCESLYDVKYINKSDLDHAVGAISVKTR